MTVVSRTPYRYRLILSPRVALTRPTRNPKFASIKAWMAPQTGTLRADLYRTLIRADIGDAGMVVASQEI